MIALDGAVLAFERSSGRRWLLRSPSTRALRAKAPPLVLFSITNACNLACGFCYRDQRSRSTWTVESAFQLLSTLAQNGTLEVAFGGGEPFAFAGFTRLIERLTDETSLVVHVTTNGQLISREKAQRLRGRVGEFRLSVYDDQPWRESLSVLQNEGFSVGLHWLVTPERLPKLRAFAEEVVALGVSKLFLLSYNGSDPSLHLDHSQTIQLTHTIQSLADLPPEIGISACWGDRLQGVQRLSPDRGRDCGAGDYFVSIGPDGTMSPCSFHHQRRTARTAEDVLHTWNAMRSPGPARMRGCHRPSLPMHTEREFMPDGLWRWRAWSGNNSVDCFAVGRFANQNEAQTAIDELRSLTAGNRPPLLDQAWEALQTAQDELRRSSNETVVVNALWDAEQTTRQQWLEEVAQWENELTPLERYATDLGVDLQNATLPAEVEVAEETVAFGSIAIYLQGSTLAPFRSLPWLWAYRGGKVYDFARNVSNDLQVVWAAKTSSPGQAIEYAEQLSGIARGPSVWGLSPISRWDRGRTGGYARVPVLANLRQQLEERSLRFDGVVIADRNATLEDLDDAVQSARPTVSGILSRLRFLVNGERAQSVLAAIRAVNADPSQFSEWTRLPLTGSRRWPKDLGIHRFGPMFLLEAEQLPVALGRGFLLRGADTPWSVEGRELKVTVDLYDELPDEQLRNQLLSLGLEISNVPTNTQGTIVTADPAQVLQRVSALASRRAIRWNATLAVAHPITNAIEWLHSRLQLQLI